MIEIDQHDHPGFRSDPGEGDEPDRNRDGHVEPHEPHQPDAADQREGQRQHDDHGFGEPPEVEIEQQEDQCQGQRDDDREALFGAFEILELPAPSERIALRQRDGSRDRCLRLGHETAQIAARDVDEDINRQLPVFGADRCRPAGPLDGGNVAQGHGAAARQGYLNLAGDRVGVGSKRCGIAHGDVVALASLDRLGDRLGTEGHTDHILHVLYRQPIPAQGIAIWGDVQIIAADHPFGIGARGAGHGAHHRLDLARDLLHLGQVSPEDLDPHGRADTGRQHVDARTDRHGPGVRYAGKLKRRIHFLTQAFRRDAGAPLLLGTQLDDGLEHFHRCRIGGGQRPSCLSEDRLDLREGLDDAILHLHQFGGRGHRQARQGGRHVHQRAFVQDRHELRPELPRRPDCDGQGSECNDDRECLRLQHPPDDRAIHCDQRPVHRVPVFRDDPAPHEDHHQRRHQRDGEERCRRHGEGLGIGERSEHPALLTLQREDRKEGHGDD